MSHYSAMLEKTPLDREAALQYIVSLVLLTIIYYLSARFGLYLEVQYGGVTPIWPPAGIAVAIFLAKGKKYWPMIIIGEFAIARTLGQTHLAGLIGGVAQFIEASLAVNLLKRTGTFEITRSARSVLWFSALGVLIPPMISSLIGSSTLLYFGYLQGNEFVSGVLTWWLGDAIGILVLSPLLAGFKSWPFKEKAAFIRWALYTLSIALVYFLILNIGNERSYYLFFVLIPFVIIAAIHFNLIGAGSAILLLTITVFGMRPEDMGKGDFLTAIRMAFVGTSAFTGYLVTGFMETRRHRLETIRRQNSYRSALHKLTLGLISHLELDRLIDSILSSACKLFRVQDGVFCQWDGQSKHIEVKVGKGIYSNNIGYIVRAGEGLTGKIWATGQPMFINGYQQWEGRHPDTIWDAVTAIIGVPINVDSKTIGVLSVLSVEKGFQFDAGDLEIIELLGELASIAWQNTQVYAQLSDQLEARRRAEAGLRELETAIEFAVEDIMITDVNGVITYVNPAFESTTGYSKDEISGRKPNVLKSGQQDEAFYADLWNTILSGHLWTGQIYNKCKNGNIVLQEANIAPIRDNLNDIVGFVSVKRDITEQVRIREQLIQAQKMQAIGTLAGGIAHDFNNMLSGIIGYTELAMTYNLPGDHPARKNLQEVLHAGYRAADLIKQILTFSRAAEIDARTVDVKVIIKEVIKLIKTTLPPAVELEFYIHATRTYVKASPTYIHQIIMNLVTNAMHALPDEKGKIEIALSNMEIDDASPMVYSKLGAGEYIRISVSDTGHGIAEDSIERVFDPYYTTKDVDKGTGLGLSIVHGIVESLAGAIYVESEVDKGSTFRVLLPVDEKSKKEDPEESRSLPTGTESILFVDDNPMITDIGAQTLEKLGYEVTVFSDSVAALNRFKEHPDAFSLVITDMVMPKMSGLELSRKISSIRPELPIIICTGNPNTISRKDTTAIGVKAIAPKPLDLASMSVLVRKMLDSYIKKPS